MTDKDKYPAGTGFNVAVAVPGTTFGTMPAFFGHFTLIDNGTATDTRINYNMESGRLDQLHGLSTFAGACKR